MFTTTAFLQQMQEVMVSTLNAILNSIKLIEEHI